jgi:hypothetical protein
VEVVGDWDLLGASNRFSEDEALCAAGRPSASDGVKRFELVTMARCGAWKMAGVPALKTNFY